MRPTEHSSTASRLFSARTAFPRPYRCDLACRKYGQLRRYPSDSIESPSEPVNLTGYRVSSRLSSPPILQSSASSGLLFSCPLPLLSLLRFSFSILPALSEVTGP